MPTADVAGRRAVLGALLGLVLLVGSGCGTPPASAPSPSPTGVHIVGSGSSVAPVLGVVVNPDLRVVDVQPNSAAAQAGIRRGDVLTTIGDQVLPTPAAAPVGTAPRRSSPQARPSPTDAQAAAKNAFRRQANHGQAIAIGLKRNGQPLDFQIVPGGIGSALGAPTPTMIPADADLDFF